MVNPIVRPRGCFAGCATLALLLVVSLVGVYVMRRAWLPYVGKALDVRPEVRTADVIIVLGGGDGDREEYGSILYRRGLAPRIISTGAPLGTDVATVSLVKRGIPRQAVLLANGTQNTHEDALRSRDLMRQHGWRTALLVTDPYHMRRSLWTFRTAFAGTEMQVWPAPVVSGWFDADHWWQNEQGFVAVNDEYLKLVFYLARGYIQPSAIMAR